MNNTIKIRDREIIEISEQDVPKYHSLGKGVGAGINHCIYLAQKYTPNFFERVVAYRIVTESRELEWFKQAHKEGIRNYSVVEDSAFERLRNTPYISVEFYEQKPKEEISKEMSDVRQGRKPIVLISTEGKSIEQIDQEVEKAMEKYNKINS